MSARAKGYNVTYLIVSGKVRLGLVFDRGGGEAPGGHPERGLRAVTLRLRLGLQHEFPDVLDRLVLLPQLDAEPLLVDLGQTGVQLNRHLGLRS